MKLILAFHLETMYDFQCDYVGGVTFAEQAFLCCSTTPVNVLKSNPGHVIVYFRYTSAAYEIQLHAEC